MVADTVAGVVPTISAIRDASKSACDNAPIASFSLSYP
jgi:hypothetical protein